MSARDPIEIAARSLRHRDQSRREIDERLAKAGVDEVTRADALERLERVGYVDDARFAHARAEALATRGFGDAGIRFDLERHGLAAGEVETALSALPPEAERAAALLEREGRTRKVASRLARKGFSAESLETALGDGGPSAAPDFGAQLL
jgi:regulatory protein